MRTIIVKVPVDPAPTVEREVVLPAYGAYARGATDSGDRVNETAWLVDENLVKYYVQISYWLGEIDNVELERDKVDPETGSVDYHFGFGKYASDGAEFRALLAKARTFLARFPGGETS